MSTPQDSPARRKQKRRRTVQLAHWREKARAKQLDAAPAETSAPAKTASK
jgi:hypothetical protein